MDKFLYISMNGAKQIMRSQIININNMSNVSTPGFKADLTRFLQLPVQGPGYETRVYSQMTDPASNLGEGKLVETGNALDVVIRGKGFIAVQGSTGGEAYTRGGTFRISPNGLLETYSGYEVLGNGGPIAIPPYDKLEIGEDGTISIIPSGQESTTMVVLDRIKLVNPRYDDMKKEGDGLFYPKNGETLEADAEVKTASGFFESSNVNAVEEMVTMIELARQYEMHVKMMHEAKENDAAASKIMNMN